MQSPQNALTAILLSYRVTGIRRVFQWLSHRARQLTALLDIDRQMLEDSRLDRSQWMYDDAWSGILVDVNFPFLIGLRGGTSEGMFSFQGTYSIYNTSLSLDLRLLSPAICPG